MAFEGDEQFAEFVEDAIARKRNSISKTLTEAFSPMVKTHMCIRGEEAVSSVSKEFAKGTTLYNIVKNGVLLIGALEGQELRKDFQVYVEAVIERFSELGFTVITNVIKYSTGLDLVGALTKGEVDLIHPGFYVDELYGERLKDLQPLCTGVGLEFAYFVKEKVAGEGSPYKNMKDLVEHTLEKNKKIVVFNNEVASILLKMYPTLDRSNLRVDEIPDNSLDYLNDVDKVSAVFVQQTFKESQLDKKSATVLKNYFVMPLTMYSRVENRYIMMPHDHEMKIQYKGNAELRSVLDYIISKYQNSNTHFSFSTEDRSSTMGDCMANRPQQPTYLKMSGVLQRIRSEKLIRVGYVTGKTTLLKVVAGEVPDISGPLYDFEVDIFNKLAKYLQVSKIDILPVVFNNAEELFRGLDKGDIDVTSASMLEGGAINGAERRWRYEYTCSTAAWPLTIVTPKKKNNVETAKTLHDLKIYLQKTTNAKFAVANSAMCDLIESSLDMEVKCTTVSNNDEGFKYIHEEPEYIAYIPEYLINVDSSLDLRLIHTDQYVSTTMFLRKDRKLSPASVEESTTVRAFTILLSMVLGALCFVAVYMFYRYFVLSSTNAVLLESETLGEDDDEQDNKPLKENVQSLGDEDDPDYIAPAF